MKKILSLILSFTIAISSMEIPCFAQDCNLSVDVTNVKTNFESLTQDNLNSCVDECISKIVKDESKEDRTVKYAFFPLIWNLSKLIAIKILKSVADLTVISFDICYNVVCVAVKGASKIVLETGKILGRAPSSFYDMLTGYKSKQIKELQEEIDRIKIEYEKCSGQ